MTLDLNGNFDRIDYHGAAEPSLDVLRDLVTAHAQTIPFENLDPVMGVPVDDRARRRSPTSWSTGAGAAIATSRTG